MDGAVLVQDSASGVLPCPRCSVPDELAISCPPSVALGVGPVERF